MKTLGIIGKTFLDKNSKMNAKWHRKRNEIITPNFKRWYFLKWCICRNWWKLSVQLTLGFGEFFPRKTSKIYYSALIKNLIKSQTVRMGLLQWEKTKPARQLSQLCPCWLNWVGYGCGLFALFTKIFKNLFSGPPNNALSPSEEFFIGFPQSLLQNFL